MIFLHPLVFVLILPLSYLIYTLYHPRISTTSSLFSPLVYQRLFVSQGGKKNVRLILLWLSGALMITALARPVLPPEKSAITQEGYDIMIALDLSHSMSATDVYPSRIDAAKEKIASLIQAYPQHRFGIIGFSSHPFVIAPLTSDTETLLYLVDSLQKESIISKGTNILGALSLCTKLSHASQKTVIIFSDGGDNENFKEEISFANAQHTTLYMISTATPQGSTLVDEDQKLIRDKNGHIVLSSIHPDSEELTSQTGGITHSITRNSSDIQAIMNHISSHLDPLVTTQFTMFNKREFFMYPLSGSLILLFLALFKIPLRGISFLVILSSLPLHSGMLDFHSIKKGTTLYQQGRYEEAIEPFETVAASTPSPEALYNLANCYYKTKRYTQAINTYKKIISDNHLFLAKVGHNIGNAYAMKEEYENAKFYYEQSLKLHYNDHTYRNLQKIATLQSLQSVSLEKKSKMKDAKESQSSPAAANKSSSVSNNSSSQTSQGSSGQSQKRDKTDELMGRLSNKKPSSQHFIPTSSKGNHDEKPW